MKNADYVQTTEGKYTSRELVSSHMEKMAKDFPNANFLLMPSTKWSQELDFVVDLPRLNINKSLNLFAFENDPIKYHTSNFHHIPQLRKHFTYIEGDIMEIWRENSAAKIFDKKFGTVYMKNGDYFEPNQYFAWLDLCSGISPNKINNFSKIISELCLPGSKIFITFDLTGQRCIPVKGVRRKINKKTNTTDAKQSAKSIQNYLLEQNPPLQPLDEPFIYYSYRGIPFGLFGFEVTDNNSLTKIQNLDIYEDSMTNQNQNKTPETYATLANRGFTNPQIAVFWRTGIQNIAGYAAAAKRKGLV